MADDMRRDVLAREIEALRNCVLDPVTKQAIESVGENADRGEGKRECVAIGLQ